MIRTVCIFIICLITALTGLWAVSAVLGWTGRAAQVVQQQVDPVELLRKYEIFKDEAAQLDAKRADIEQKRHAIASIQHVEMDRTNREQLMIWQQELGGMIYSYNELAADYNSQMSKINWSFCNVGSLPQGATEPLPRAFKPYLEN